MTSFLEKILAWLEGLLVRPVLAQRRQARPVVVRAERRPAFWEARR